LAFFAASGPDTIAWRNTQPRSTCSITIH
jgi:hypothetical protein